MSRWRHLPSIAITAFLLLAVVFSVLPHNWIESIFAVDPDGGSGFLELMLVSLAIAIAFAVYLFRRPSRAPRETDSHSIVPR
jgi:hypothetical protein